MTTQTLDQVVDSSAVRDGGANGTGTPSPQSRVTHVAAGTGTAYWGPGSLMTFLITGKETGGAFFLAEMLVPPGGGPPPHVHQREDESFHILEGTLTIQMGEDRLTASSGDTAFLPRGIAHSFKNDGDVSAKALVLLTPAGLENYFAEVFDRAEDASAIPPPPSQELIARARAASARYGLELLPPK
jgi:quercetin dioxygenase-like cupin family protein